MYRQAEPLYPLGNLLALAHKLEQLDTEQALFDIEPVQVVYRQQLVAARKQALDVQALYGHNVMLKALVVPVPRRLDRNFDRVHNHRHCHSARIAR